MDLCNLHQLLLKSRRPGFEAVVRTCEADFTIVPFLTVFYQHLHCSVLLSIAAIAVILPICFQQIKHTADQFMSVSIQNIKDRFRISSLVTACTLIPFANGAPDIINAITSGTKTLGTQISSGCLLGSYLFSIAVIVGAIVMKSKEGFVRLPIGPFYKEHVFYFLGLCLILVFGLVGRVTIFHAQLFLVAYLAYLFCTFYFGEQEEFSNFSEFLCMCERDIEASSEPAPASLTEELKGLLLPKGNMLLNATAMPFKLLYLITVPYRKNPLLGLEARYVVIFSSLVFSLTTFGLISSRLLVLFMSYSVTMVVAALANVKGCAGIKLTIQEVCTLASSLAWMKLTCSLVMDCIFFASFLFSIDEVLLAIVVVSVGNSLQDLFSNIALAQMGHEMMAVLATFSGQLCNLFIGMWLNLSLSNSPTFSLFSAEKGTHSMVGAKLLLSLIAFSFAMIAISLVSYHCSGRGLAKSYFYVGSSVYLCLVAFAVSYTYVNRFVSGHN